MKVIADANIVPVGLENSDFPVYFGTVGKVVDDCGLDYGLQVHGFNLAGEMDQIWDVAKNATKSLYSSHPELDHMVTFIRIHSFNKEGLKNIGINSEDQLTLASFVGKMKSEFVKR